MQSLLWENLTSEISAFSFDIFDTLLTRTVGCPQAVFHICGIKALEKRIINISPFVFKSARIQAESRSRHFYNGEVTLEEIYIELGHILSLSNSIVEQILEIELSVETEVIVPIAGARQMITDARQKSSRICFTSDMYLPNSFLIERLHEHGFWQEGDRLYTSGDLRISKARGDLFSYVLSDLDIQARQLIHVGNHAQHDIATAKRLEINVEQKFAANLNQYEKNLESFSACTEGVTSILAGASRLARLTVKTSSEHETIIRDVAAGVAAPVLLTYVTWVIQSAIVQGLECLYFLARDGEILLRIAKHIAPKLNPNLELRYLYASRQALRLPGIFEITEQVLDWIFEDTDILTVHSIMKRVNLHPEDHEIELASWGFPSNCWQLNLNQEQRVALKQKFSDGSIANAILKSATKKRETLLAYLKQEGLLSKVKYGIVDLCWHGSLQASLEKVLTYAGASLPIGYYFGISERCNLAIRGEVHGFFFDNKAKTGIKNFTYNPTPIMEIFCAGSHGTTLEYSFNGLKVSPCLKEETNVEAIEWGLLILQETIEEFTKVLTDCWSLKFHTGLLLEPINQLLAEFLSKPDSNVAKVFGSFPYFDDPNELYQFSWAPPLKLLDVAKFAFGQTNSLAPHRAAWVAACITNSSKIVRQSIGISYRVRSFRHKLDTFMKLMR